MVLLFHIFSGVFQPVLGVLCATGMIKGLNALLLALGIVTATDGTHIILNAIGAALVYPTILSTKANELYSVFSGTMFEAIMAKTKDKKLKSLCIPAVISGIFGVTEPAIYGITLSRKKPFILSCIGGAVTGGIIGFCGSKGYSAGAMGIFALPSYIGPDGLDLGFYGIAIAMVAGIIVGFLLMFFCKLDEEDNENKDSKQKAELVWILYN